MIRVTVTDNGRLVVRDVVEHDPVDLEFLDIPLAYRGHEVNVKLEFGIGGTGHAARVVEG